MTTSVYTRSAQLQEQFDKISIQPSDFDRDMVERGYAQADLDYRNKPGRNKRFRKALIKAKQHGFNY
jgi:hypothetical protein